jgi:predicted alpha/beta superfamily hydrolase
LAGAQAGSPQPLVIGETFTVASAVLKEVRRINVYLPPAYVEAKDTQLPVLYMPDGGVAEDFVHVAGLVQISIANATMRPFILVGIENTERRRDLTGPTASADDRAIAPRVGGSAAFRAFIRTELMPAIETRYRTTDETAIVGESLAGLFVVETLLREPDLFDTYIAFDPSLWWNGESLLADAGGLLRARPASKKVLYLSSSSEPGLANLARRFVAVLEKGRFAGLDWRHRALTEETHSSLYHPAALLAFRELFGPSAR